MANKESRKTAYFIPGDIKSLTELEHLESLGHNFPEGCLFRLLIEVEILKRADAENIWMNHLQLLYLSSSWEQIGSTPREEVMTDFSLSPDKIHPDDRAKLLPAIFRSIVNCTLFSVELRYICSDTETRWIQISSHPRRHDRSIVCDGFLLDITALKKAERELLPEKTRVRTFRNNIPDEAQFRFFVEPQKKVELARNRAELEFLVKERTEELAVVNEELQAINEEFVAANEELANKNILLEQEINARIDIMKKLEASETKLRNFIQQSFEGIMIFDSNGHIIEWNKTMEDITGYKRDEVIGKIEWEMLWQLLPEKEQTPQVLNDLHRSQLEFIQAGGKQKPVLQEFSIYSRQGIIRHIRVSMFPIKMEDTCHFGRILRDNTKRRKIEMELSHYRSNLEQMVEEKTRELTIAKERAEEAHHLKSAFLANMSHEVRTPLNGIVGLLNILADDPHLPESIREHMDIINTNSEILQRLISDILDAAKIDAGQMKICPEPVCINDMMNEMQILFTHHLLMQNKTHIFLENMKCENSNDCIVYADPVRLQQIIQNLLSNAIKFTNRGHIRFGYRLIENDLIEFYVEDTGIGIPENQLEYIFHQFRQAEVGNNRRFGGSGLGLTISRSLSQMMGGDMYVKSTEGMGSTFTFTIAYNPCNLV